jgi:acyl-CoA reductase-like NAD-dependent aldehyde dehydrogenase
MGSVDEVIGKLGYLAGAALNATVSSALPDARAGGHNDRRLHRVPVGVVAAITPWNIPLDIPLAKVGGALAAGNTVVLKPAPDTPLAINLVGRVIAEETDIPAGVVNIVASSDHSLGKLLVDDPRVDFVSFTGSSGSCHWPPRPRALTPGRAASCPAVCSSPPIATTTVWNWPPPGWPRCPSVTRTARTPSWVRS